MFKLIIHERKEVINVSKLDPDWEKIQIRIYDNNKLSTVSGKNYIMV